MLTTLQITTHDNIHHLLLYLLQYHYQMSKVIVYFPSSVQNCNPILLQIKKKTHFIGSIHQLMEIYDKIWKPEHQ